MARAARRAVLALVLAHAGCASIPEQRYAVSSLEVSGAEELDAEALKACLATHERPWFQVSLGRTADPQCGVPPFDSGRVTLSFWRWPWTEWPLYDRSVFERDVERVERWYRARGYYQARVLSTEVTPPVAQESDRIAEDQDVCGEDDEGCKVEIHITVEEGEPVLVESVTVVGIERLPVDVQEDVRGAVELVVGERFDEALYDRSKEDIADVLANASFALAEIDGRIEIDPERRIARVELSVDSGPPCVFGDITVEGHAGEDLPADTIAAAALIDPGDPFSKDTIGEAQRAIYSLGAFSTVEVEPQLPEGEPASVPVVIPLTVRVVPGRLFRFGVGAGIQVGTFEFSQAEEGTSVPQWDVHLIGILEWRNFLGGLRRFRIEERPRLIFTDDRGFPRTGTPRPGNDLRVEFRQPAFFEPRTTLVTGARWDLGPDPFKAYFRHDITALIGPERYFFDGRLFLGIHVNENIFIPRDPEVQTPSPYEVMFLDQIIRLDLRDNPRDPRYGAYFGISVHEAGYFLPASWDYIRLTPEARGYVPLPFGVVLAARFGIGAMFITGVNDPTLDTISQEAGPERYRLRGGGANSNRGYLPGNLGDSELGGLRRWEGNLELRVPITANFGAVAFADVGDVHAGETFRFDFIHLSVGLGLRYRTIVGPLRFDVGYQVPEQQVLGQADAFPVHRLKSEVDFFFVKFPGAVHLTIGEAF
jgi:outer membrane translocation and assembly module TamA